MTGPPGMTDEQDFERFCLRHLGEAVRLTLWGGAPGEGGEPQRVAGVFQSLRSEWSSLAPALRLPRLHRLALGRETSPAERLLATLLHSNLPESVIRRLVRDRTAGGDGSARLVSGWIERGGRDGVETGNLEAAYAALGSLPVSRGEEECPRGRILADRAAGRPPLSERDRLDRHLLLCPRCETNEDAIRARLAWSADGPERADLYEHPDSLLLPWERRGLLAECLGRGTRPRLFPWLSGR